MKRFLLTLLSVFIAAPAWALPAGAPGFALHNREQDFSITGGLGYAHRQVRGAHFADTAYDTQSTIRFVVRGQYAVQPWLTPMLTVGMGDRSRKLTDFSGELGVIAGAGLRIDPVIQRRNTGFGVAVVVQGSYERSSGTGRYRIFDEDDNRFRESGVLKQADLAQTWHLDATLLFSRKEGRVSFYGGPRFDYDWTYYDTRDELVRPYNPFGIVIGIDYDVTPEVFFSAEMENFHQDSLYILVGGRF